MKQMITIQVVIIITGRKNEPPFTSAKILKYSENARRLNNAMQMLMSNVKLYFLFNILV